MIDAPRSCFPTKFVLGVLFGFSRRHYSNRTFTWVHYRGNDNKWHEYVGDPWPSVKVPTKDLERIAKQLGLEGKV